MCDVISTESCNKNAKTLLQGKDGSPDLFSEDRTVTYHGQKRERKQLP